MEKQQSLTVGAANSTTDAVLEPLADVSRRHGLDPLAARLLQLKMWLHDDLADLEAAITGCESENPDLSQRAAMHLLRLPGKRIRPLCVMLAARIGDRELDSVVCDLAVSCELIHAATLLHDDVIDDGTERRGEPAARIIFGNSASILGGDHLLIEALRRVERAGEPELLRGLLDVIGKMIEAEAIQLERRGRFDARREIYLRVIEGKTAALFQWGLEAGGTAAGLDALSIAALGSVGFEFGMAFQLVDDVLDLEGDPRDTGKNAFADLKEGKLTWPLIVGTERDETVAERLRAVVADPELIDDVDFAADIVLRLQELGCLEATREVAREHGERALAELSRLADGPARRAISAVIEAALRRSK